MAVEAAPIGGSKIHTPAPKPLGDVSFTGPTSEEPLIRGYEHVVLFFKNTFLGESSNPSNKKAEIFVNAAVKVLDSDLSIEQKMEKINGLMKEHLGVRNVGFNRKSFRAFLVDPKNGKEIGAKAFLEGIALTINAFTPAGVTAEASLIDYMTGKEFTVIGASSKLIELNNAALRKVFDNATNNTDLFNRMSKRDLSQKNFLNELIKDALEQLGKTADGKNMPLLEEHEKNFLFLMMAARTAAFQSGKITSYMEKGDKFYDPQGSEALAKYMRGLENVEQERNDHINKTVNLYNGNGWVLGDTAENKTGTVAPAKT